MSRSLTVVAAALAALSLTALSAQAQTAAAPAKKAVAKKPVAKKAEPAAATNDHLSPGQLAAAEHVLTGVAECEMKEKVDIEKIAGHDGNFKVTYNHKTYTMVPEETTTGAVRLVDLTGAVVWIQIPMKSMLMNQKEHHRLVDGCEEAEQRSAVAAQQQSTNAAATAAAAQTAAPGSTITTTTTTTTQVVAPAPVKNAAAAPTTAASGMWK